MKILGDEIYEILDNATKIGEGRTRVVVKHHGRVVKIAYEGCEEENRNEVEIYSNNWYKERYKFLNKVIGYTEDYKIIEVEELNCKWIENFYDEAKEEHLFIEELTEIMPGLKECVDFDIDYLYEFMENLELDDFECLEPFQWGVNKDGKLRLSDYSR